MTMRAAFYKGTRPGMPGLYNRFVRTMEPGQYSHGELVFSDGVSASASFMDGGVRFTQIDFNPAKWDLVALPGFNEDFARQWFIDHEGAKYNLLGQLHFVCGPIRGFSDHVHCSQSIAEALRFKDAWRYGPNLLNAVLCRLTREILSTNDKSPIFVG